MAPLQLSSLLRSSSSSSSSSAAPRLPLFLAIAGGSLVFHLYFASALAALRTQIDVSASAGDEDGSDWRRLEAIGMGVSVARLSSWASAGVACLGLWGAVRSHLPFVRLFTLNSFLSLLLELVLLILITFTAFFTSSPSHTSVSSTLCRSISNADLSLDLFGYSLESCEERFNSIVLTALGFVATIALLRAWGSLKTLEFYEAMSKRHRRKQPSLSIDTRSSNGGGRYRDGGEGVEPSPSKRHHSSGGGGGGQRILLLPDPLSRAREAAARQAQGGGEEEVPMLSLQPASPARASFPPQPVASTSAATHDEQAEQKYLVYAPVMMTAEEARLVGAREIVVGGSSSHRSHRPRSRSTATATTTSPHPRSATATDRPLPPRSASGESDLITPVAERGEGFGVGGGSAGGGTGKGKVA